MKSDFHKGILGIEYNSLNLPQELRIKNTEVSGKVYYTYSASGVKLKTKHMKSKNLGYAPVTGTAGDANLDVIKTTDYVGNKVYENDQLKRILVDGGYYEGGVYYYYLTDHLGNNRVVANASGTVVQKNHYYPFGTAFAEGTADKQGKQHYKYNGKELAQMHGLNLYDYSARYYESAIGRFTTIDPHAEKYYSISPYVYCFNNPLKFIDPDGKDGIAVFKIDDNGNVSVEINVNIYIYGSGANTNMANQMQTNIMNDWNQGWTYKDPNTGNEYAISFNVNVDVYDKTDPTKGPGLFSNKNNPFSMDNFIEVGATASDVSRSYVKGGDEGRWRGYGTDPSSHEFGHLIGLKDHYTDTGGTDPAWKGNIMAEPVGVGVVEQKNIDALATPLVRRFNDQKIRTNARNIYNNKIYKVNIDEGRSKW